MSHQCDDCGETFETLTRLRLHECGDQSAGSDLSESWAESGPSARDRATVSALDDCLERVTADPAAIYEAVATYETALDSALAADDGGETYRDVFWAYYEPVAEALDAVVRAEGWGRLAEILDAYDPAEDGEVPLSAPAIENAVGRHLIRTRLTEEVDQVPTRGLDYLVNVVDHAVRGDDVAREEAHAFGWGIGHPDYPVADGVHARVSEDPFWVHATLEHAFYADQHAAVELLERILTDDSLEPPDTHYDRLERHLLDCVVGPDSGGFWPTTPRYWEWHETFEYAFTWDPEVERRVRDLVVETGVADELPDDWTLQDLAV